MGLANPWSPIWRRSRRYAPDRRTVHDEATHSETRRDVLHGFRGPRPCPGGPQGHQVSPGDAGVRHAGPVTMSRRTLRVLTATIALGVSALLLWPNQAWVPHLVNGLHDRFLGLGVPASIRPGHYEAALNVMAFVPLGFAAVVLLRRPLWQVVVALLALSVGAEIVQALPVMDRQPSLRDVLTNGTGAVLGTIAGSVFRHLRDRNRGMATEM